MEETKGSPEYQFDVIKWFGIMAVVYLVVGALIGVYIAAELAWPVLNFDLPYISFGRLRPLHTNAVIFAFGGLHPLRYFLLCGSAHLLHAALER